MVVGFQGSVTGWLVEDGDLRNALAACTRIGTCAGAAPRTMTQVKGDDRRTAAAASRTRVLRLICARIAMKCRRSDLEPGGPVRASPTLVHPRRR